MKQEQLVNSNINTTNQASLKEQIAQLRHELDNVSNKVNTFEAVLKSNLASELIEEQELSVLYKEQKKIKKEKRLVQKRRGKKYVVSIGIIVQKQEPVVPNVNEADKKEKKRLYREAMIHIHPDKFSMDDSKINLATELTTRLIEIYKTENLATLEAYHTHLFNNEELIAETSKVSNINILTSTPDTYLQKEKEQLEKKLDLIKSRHTYHVLTTYGDLSIFINELRKYYQDRIMKLKRRTRIKVSNKENAFEV